MTLPTFLVVGAMKAGTTSLHRYLDAHPDVFMSRTKQLDFFVEDREWHRGPDWYRAQFAAAGDALAVGETSPRYSKDPLSPGVPERVLGLLPDVRIVYLLRHPLDRIRSHHRHALGEWTDRPLAEALRTSRAEYVVPSRYGHQLACWRAHLPPERIHVLTLEDLAADHAGTMATLFRFVGVDPDRAPDEAATTHNPAGGHRRLPGVVQRARGGALYRGLRHRVPRPVRHLAWRTTSRAHPVDLGLAEIPPDLEQELLDELRPDLAQLRTMLPDFHCWGLVDDAGAS